MASLHKKDDLHTQSAHELSDCTARFRPGYWTFVSPGSESTWKYDKTRTDIVTNKFYGAFKFAKSLVTQLFPAQPSSNRVSLTQKREEGIHFNASTESVSMIFKLI